MVSTPTKISIPFHPLLKTITDYLQLPDPVYQFLDASKNNACVAVKTNCGPIAYNYVSGECRKIEESCDRAVQKAVHDLMKKYSVHVEDVTTIKKQIFGRCAYLYHLKRVVLERVEKGVVEIPLRETFPKIVSGDSRFVSVDFVMVLRAVLKKLDNCSTPIETVEQDKGQFTSWFSIKPHTRNPSATCALQCIFGDSCPSLSEAKQNLSKKVITYLMAAYNFEVVNANYDPADSMADAIRYDLERESYLTVKECVLAIEEKVEPSLLLVEQDCLTPKGPAFRLPTTTSPPLPPKKRKMKTSIVRPSVGTVSNISAPTFALPIQELETIFKRSKTG
ncbi:hypothetical protein RND81_10G072500 [Saponaria officinalis]|uniref:Uncharacterized protein n=1 Tax=Saponaria officinalis TaxID=3572 RepID=A0AAW1HYL7_SAPOF